MESHFQRRKERKEGRKKKKEGKKEGNKRNLNSVFMCSCMSMCTETHVEATGRHWVSCSDIHCLIPFQWVSFRQTGTKPVASPSVILPPLLTTVMGHRAAQLNPGVVFICFVLLPASWRFELLLMFAQQ